jgi:hypothetical protein
VKPRTRDESVPGLPHPSRYASLGKDSKEIRQAREYSCVTNSCTCYMRAKSNLSVAGLDKKGGLCPPAHLWDIAFPERNATSRQAVQLSKHRYSAFQAERQGHEELLIVTNNTSHRGNEGRTTRLYAIVMIKTSILFLNDLRLDVRTACERNPTKDTPTTNTNKSQAKKLSTPVNSLMRRRDMLVSGRAAVRRVAT